MSRQTLDDAQSDQEAWWARAGQLRAEMRRLEEERYPAAVGGGEVY